MNEFTGERVVPGEVNLDLWNEHFARYAVAAEYAANRRVLDIGCGTGYGSAHLARHAATVTAIDVAPEALSYGREHFPLGNLRFERASATALPFRDASFDMITAFEVIEHLEDWPGLISEAARVLAPGGVALISTPNRLYYTLSRGTEGANPFHVHEFDAQEFEAALSLRFEAVTLLLQNRAECVAFYPHRQFPPATACLESTGGSPDTAHFFLALCAHHPELAAPRSFVYVPRAANVLREREQHIALLQADLAKLNAAHADLLQAHRAQTAHLEEQNRWALATAAELEGARERIVELDEHIKALAQGYESRLRELDDELRAKAEWGTRLTTELAEAVRVLHDTEAALEQRTQWAQQLDQQLARAESTLGMVRDSRWVRLGRSIRVGPDLQP